MATLLKIKGLDRGDASPSSGTAMSSGNRGFRVPSALGLTYPAGFKAFEIVGTVGAPNAAVRYDAKNPGAFGNNIKVVQNAPSGASTVITVAYATTTGFPTITVTPSTTDTAATTAAAINNHNEASQYVTASVVGTGASAPVASADANAVVTISQATGTSTAGTFTLTFPGFGTTAAISAVATGATVATAVQLITGGTVTGSGTTLPASTTLTFSGTLANTPIANPSVDNTLNTGGTYSTAVTTYGRAAAGTFGGGQNVGTSSAVLTAGQIVGTGLVQYRAVNSKSVVVVDLDDPQTQRVLFRNKNRWVSLGQP
jgi:hypothetical protein